MGDKKKKGLFAYVPCIHQGYLDFFEKHLKDGDELYLLNVKEIAKRGKISELEHFERDLRAVSTDLVFEWLKLYFAEKKIKVHVGILKMIDSVKFYAEHHVQKSEAIVMPDDDVTALILDKMPHLREHTTLERMFLRWDMKATLLKHQVAVAQISERDLPEKVVAELKKQVLKSHDWWRQTGTVIFDSEGNILVGAYNRHFPNDLALNVFGDTRFNFTPGVGLDYFTSIHSEAAAIVASTRTGKPLVGMSMLVSDFPCANCARLVAGTGIKTLYFVKGYSNIDGQKVIEDAGIEIKHVLFEE
ncbi:MAG: zinc-binding CMP/dCMP deaminase, dCMP deaminase [Patescibacteria group bacterium]|nr:zinc-binding CMP/dCMP deaminase, dCMP deaminase [Patescibacteria group bacterium]